MTVQDEFRRELHEVREAAAAMEGKLRAEIAERLVFFLLFLLVRWRARVD